MTSNTSSAFIKCIIVITQKYFEIKWVKLKLWCLISFQFFLSQAFEVLQSLSHMATRGRCTQTRCIDHQQWRSVAKSESTGASVCRTLRLSTCLSPRSTSPPAYISPAHRMLCWETTKDFTAATGETCHTQLPLTCWLQFMEVTLSVMLNRNMVIFSSGFWEFWKNGWIFPNVEKEKGGELLTF